MPEYLESELSDVPSQQIQESEEKLARLEKPYLRESDLEGNPRKEVITLEWMDYLLSKTSVNGILDALSYYIEMGWIGRGVRSKLMSYTRYFLKTKQENPVSEIKMGERSYRVGEGESEEASPRSPAPERGATGTEELTLQDHLRSLAYILQLSDRADEEIRQEIMKKVE